MVIVILGLRMRNQMAHGFGYFFATLSAHRRRFLDGSTAMRALEFNRWSADRLPQSVDLTGRDPRRRILADLCVTFDIAPPDQVQQLSARHRTMFLSVVIAIKPLRHVNLPPDAKWSRCPAPHSRSDPTNRFTKAEISWL